MQDITKKLYETFIDYFIESELASVVEDEFGDGMYRFISSKVDMYVLNIKGVLYNID